jgi:hypothetical protein
MCGCRSPLRRTCPPPPHIKKAFDLKWYTIPLHPDPLPPCEGGRGCREWGDVIPISIEGFRVVKGTFWAGTT